MSDSSRDSDDPIEPTAAASDGDSGSEGTVIETPPTERTQTSVTVTDVDARLDTRPQEEEETDDGEPPERDKLEAALGGLIVQVAQEPATRTDIGVPPKVGSEEGNDETTVIVPPGAATGNEGPDRQDEQEQEDRPTRRVHFASDPQQSVPTRPVYDHGTVELGDELPPVEEKTQIAPTRRDRPRADPPPGSETPVAQTGLQPLERTALLVAVGVGLVAMIISYVIGRLG